MKQAALLVMIWLLLIPSAYGAGVFVGEYGRTYPIIETSFLDDMRAAAKKLPLPDPEKLKRQIQSWRPELPKLPRARVPSTRMVDMSVELDHDIPDPLEPGKIKYAKGYRINPLDQVRYSRTIVVIDPTDKAQAKWFKESSFAKDQTVMLLITDGAYMDMARLFARPVYYMDTLFAKRFDVRAVPSVIRQQGNQMQVREYVVK